MAFLTQANLENIKNYRHTASGFTFIETHLFEHFWNFVAWKLPLTLAPNVITLGGFVFPLSFMAYHLCVDHTLALPVSPFFFFLLAFAHFWFQTCDAVDGKQARRTDNCSPLGQILDHSLDQVSYVFFYVGTLQCLRTGPGWMCLGLIYAGLAPHFSIEYRKYFTNHHSTVLGVLGATEDLTIKYVMMVVVGCNGQDWFFKDLGDYHPMFTGIINWYLI